MINSLYIAETGLNAQKTLVDVISNNIANVNTPGFKKTKVDFVDLIYKNQQAEASGESSSEMQFRGVHVDSVGQDLTPGKLKYTQHPFDIAIQGNGFLPVINENDELLFTRIGRLTVDSEGYLSTSAGHRLEASIAIPPDLENIIIEKDGTVLGILANESEPMELGQIELAKFANPDGLTAAGEGLYASNQDSGSAYYYNLVMMVLENCFKDIPKKVMYRW